MTIATKLSALAALSYQQWIPASVVQTVTGTDPLTVAAIPRRVDEAGTSLVRMWDVRAAIKGGAL
jgi:hypothetical protein